MVIVNENDVKEGRKFLFMYIYLELCYSLLQFILLIMN